MSHRGIAIFGRLGKGKTTLAMFLAAQENRGTLAFDPSEAIDVGIQISPGDTFNGSTVEQNLRAAVEQQISPVVFRTRFGANLEKEFEVFARFAYSLHQVSIVVDEASSLQSPQWIDPYLDNLIRYRRRHDLTVIATHHIVKDANDVLRSLVSDFYFFETHDRKDLERIEFFTNAQVREAVEQLRDLEFVHYEVESQRMVVNSDPASWKFVIKKKEVRHV